jgi:hypothetical protein
MAEELPWLAHFPANLLDDLGKSIESAGKPHLLSLGGNWHLGRNLSLNPCRQSLRHP